MTYFLKHGSRFNVSTRAAMDLHENLPVGTYTVKFDQMAGSFFLEAIEDFEIRGKIYGDTKRHSKRILSTFQDRPNSTGVMLSGEKGSGKTLLAKMISMEAQQHGIPTIVINQPWCGESFNGFMQMIEQPTVVIFDEFEKVYEDEDQEKMLTLLDGVYPSKKLFVLTCNDTYRVNNHMKNRPGRIFYKLDYAGLTNDFIIEYCQDNLKDKTYIESICRVATVFDRFNFDMLKAMVEEMNRYDESPQEVLDFLNAKPDATVSNFNVTLGVGGKEYAADWHGNPLMGTIVIDYDPEPNNPESDYEYASFEPSDLHSVEAETGTFRFSKINGDWARLTKKAPVAPDYTVLY